MVHLYSVFLIALALWTKSSFCKTPVIIDTDVGGGVDDIVAIAAALSHPQLDVRLLVTASGDTKTRARVLAKYLQAIGRHDLPIGIGEPTDQSGLYSFFEWASDFELADYKGKVYKDGIKAMGEMLTTSEEPFDIIAIAPMTNFPRLLSEYPNVIRKASIKAMAGSVYKGYFNSSVPVAEYNVKFCPSCTEEVFAAGWDVTLTPVDTSGVADLKGDSYLLALKSLKLSTLILLEIQQYVKSVQNSAIRGNRSLIWYDPVATYLTVMDKKNSFINMGNLNLTVTKDGYTQVGGVFGNLVHVALTWKDMGLEKYRNWLAHILYTAQQNSIDPVSPSNLA